MKNTLLFILFVWLLSATAQAADRVALVIGNNEYGTSSLLKARSDAQSIGDTLSGMGFDVVRSYNANRSAMDEALSKFGQKASQAKIAVVYYAGHAIQVDGNNYLVPANVSVTRQGDLRKLINLRDLVLEAKQAKGLGLVLLDACRNNPFADSLSSVLGRSVGGRGLTRIESTPSNVLVSFATKENNIAPDNSHYARALEKYLPQSDLEVRLLMGSIRDEVMEATGNKQQPHVYGTLGRKPWYLAGQVEKVQSRIVQQQAVQVPTQISIPTQPRIAQTKWAYEPEMAFIQGGTYKMGCVSGKDCEGDETMHSVTVNDFWMGKYEVTFNEWQNCVNDGGCQSNKKPDDRGWGRGNRPVINVSWHDANEYAKWLSKKTVKDYHLPTEAEWEYAARAGSTTKYYFGNNESELCKYGNHADKSVDYGWNNKKCSDGIGKKTTKVGTYQANNWGLYDTIGNVWEWTCSAYPKGGDYDGLETQCANKNDTRSRVLRGGSWYFKPRFVRSADRHRFTAALRNGHVGFRLSRTR